MAPVSANGVAVPLGRISRPHARGRTGPESRVGIEGELLTVHGEAGAPTRTWRKRKRWP